MVGTGGGEPSRTETAKPIVPRSKRKKKTKKKTTSAKTRKRKTRRKSNGSKKK